LSREDHRDHDSALQKLRDAREAAASARKIPWYESAVFWGCFSLAAAIVPTVVAAMKKDSRSLLIVGWLFLSLSILAPLRRFRATLRWTLFAFCVAATAVGFWKMNQWLAPDKSSSEITIDYPHLEPQLVIDSVSDSQLDCHLEVENIGEWQVDNLRNAMSTEEMYGADVSMPLLPTLPSRGHLSIPCSPNSGLRKTGFCSLT
jgi:hypothetical protein